MRNGIMGVCREGTPVNCFRITETSLCVSLARKPILSPLRQYCQSHTTLPQ
uniref:Uncharacterized protein n=1 Tax=Parascaris equorum TaxID=6256 RepID=A0A914RB66_PAREQ